VRAFEDLCEFLRAGALEVFLEQVHHELKQGHQKQLRRQQLEEAPAPVQMPAEAGRQQRQGRQHWEGCKQPRNIRESTSGSNTSANQRRKQQQGLHSRDTSNNRITGKSKDIRNRKEVSKVASSCGNK
jgi:hypothetical protein